MAVFFGGTPKPTTPAMRAANIKMRSAFGNAQTTFRSTADDARGRMNTGAITRRAFTDQFRAASKAKNAALKIARKDIRTARITQAKS